MEFEDILRRLEFLEEEQRKVRAPLSVLQEQVSALANDLKLLGQQIRDLEKQLSSLLSLPTRLEQMESGIQHQREELRRLLAEAEKKSDQRLQDSVQRLSQEIAAFSQKLEVVRSAKVDIPVFEQKIKARAEEAARLRDLIDELSEKIAQQSAQQEDLRTTARVWEEAHRRDLEQITAIQGELSALRKRFEEQQQKIDLQNDSVRNLGQRVSEVYAAESERRGAFNLMLQRMQVFETDWKRWQGELENLSAEFRKSMAEVETRRALLDDSLRGVQRAESVFAELQQRLERRLNEISEVQRLGEEHLRQEWVAFRAEEQKRWTAFTLLHEQTINSLKKALESLEQKQEEIVQLAESNREEFEQSILLAQEQIQNLMNMAYEWLAAYKRTFVHLSERK
uniref:Hypothetical conserved protein n=1 Tax=uncultured Chloroflexota bacterium TaxID=166587 RepID=H5SFP5_9CHLR|nr:hypothetical conserved protein [uncultured Chloroflexota bacterium]